MEKLRLYAILLAIAMIVVNLLLFVYHVLEGMYSVLPAYIPYIVFGAIVIYYRGDLNEAWRCEHEEESDNMRDSFDPNDSISNFKYGYTSEPPEIVLNPHKKGIQKNPLCPICESPIVPAGTKYDLVYYCRCSERRKYTFDKNYDVISNYQD